jgi:hypothetical protein
MTARAWGSSPHPDPGCYDKETSAMKRNHKGEISRVSAAVLKADEWKCEVCAARAMWGRFFCSIECLNIMRTQQSLENLNGIRWGFLDAVSQAEVASVVNKDPSE